MVEISTAVGTSVDSDVVLERLDRVRARMREDGFDALLVYKVSGHAYAYGGQGYFRYLAPGITPLPIPPSMLVLTLHGPATAIMYRGLAAVEAWRSDSLRIETCEMTLRRRTVSREITDKTAEVLANGDQLSKVGIVLMNELPGWVVAQLREALPSCELVDATDALDSFMMIKSPRDVGEIQRVAELAEDVIASIFESVAPGVSEVEIVAEATRLATAHGAEYADIRLASSNPEKGGFGVGPASRKQIAMGDHLHVGLDICCDAYWVNVVRRGVLGTASDAYRDLYELVRSVYTTALGSFESGRRVGDIVKAGEDTVANAMLGGGIDDYELQRMGHGIGLENQEPPFLVRNEELRVTNDMTFALHPGVLVRSVGQAALGGIVVTSANGPRALTDFGSQLVEIA